jgi:hypothetical protein
LHISAWRGGFEVMSQQQQLSIPAQDYRVLARLTELLESHGELLLVCARRGRSGPYGLAVAFAAC